MNGTMSQKLSLIQSARSVPRALTSDNFLAIGLSNYSEALEPDQPQAICLQGVAETLRPPIAHSGESPFRFFPV
jgi:hypothetical protein